MISGKAGSGKDTVGSIIAEKLICDGHTVLVTHFADLLKYICKEFFGWDGNKNEYGRHLLQYIGTDIVRTQRPTYWAEFVAGILKMFNGRWEYVIIPDHRFPNELNTLKSNGFDVMTVHVVRPSMETQLTNEQLSHPSEHSLDGMDFDAYITNDSSIIELINSIESWVKENLYE